MKKLSIFLFAAFLITACGNESDADALARNRQEIEQYLANNNLEAEQTDSGLYYIINEAGGSERPTSTTVVTVNYVGTLLNGSQFDSGNDISFGLNQVIQGWTEGLQLIGRGGDIDLLIPAKLAYGENPPGGTIGENEALFFNVELLDF